MFKEQSGFLMFRPFIHQMQLCFQANEGMGYLRRGQRLQVRREATLKIDNITLKGFIAEIKP